MRILHVSHALPPDGVTGVENYTDALAQAQAASGHTVAAWARGGEGSAESEIRDESDGYLRVRVPHGKGHSYGHQRERWGMADRFRRFVAEWQPDIVHFQHLLFHSLQYPEIARKAGASTVLTLHDLWFGCPTVHRVNWRGQLCRVDPGVVCLACVWNARRARLVPKPIIERLSLLPGARRLLELSPTADELIGWVKTSQACLEGMDAVLSPSRFVADNLAAHGVKPDNLRLLPIAIARPAFSAADTRTGGDTLRFGVIGTHPLKGARVAIQAFRTLGDLPVELFWHGALPDDTLTADLPPHCHARGRYEQSEIERVFGSFDVLIVPSVWWENAPLVIREAFARGLPVIASDLGGMAESVRDGEDGLLFPVGDASALADCVRRLAADPDLLSHLRKGICPPVFFDEHLTELTEIYEQARDSGGGRRV